MSRSLMDLLETSARSKLLRRSTAAGGVACAAPVFAPRVNMMVAVTNRTIVRVIQCPILAMAESKDMLSRTISPCRLLGR